MQSVQPEVTNYIITIVVAITLPVALVIGLAVYYLKKIKLPERKKKSKKLNILKILFFKINKSYIINM